MLLSKCFKSRSIGHATVECSYDEGKDNDLEEEERNFHHVYAYKAYQAEKMK